MVFNLFDSSSRSYRNICSFSVSDEPSFRISLGVVRRRCRQRSSHVRRRVCRTHVRANVGSPSRIDGPTVVKFTGHLDERSSRLMVLFKMLPPREEEEGESQKTTAAASIILSTSTFCHFTPRRQMFGRVCVCEERLLDIILNVWLLFYNFIRHSLV